VREGSRPCTGTGRAASSGARHAIDARAPQSCTAAEAATRDDTASPPRGGAGMLRWCAAVMSDVAGAMGEQHSELWSPDPKVASEFRGFVWDFLDHEVVGTMLRMLHLVRASAPALRVVAEPAEEELAEFVAAVPALSDEIGLQDHIVHALYPDDDIQVEIDFGVSVFEARARHLFADRGKPVPDDECLSFDPNHADLYRDALHCADAIAELCLQEGRTRCTVLLACFGCDAARFAGLDRVDLGGCVRRRNGHTVAAFLLRAPRMFWGSSENDARDDLFAQFIQAHAPGPLVGGSRQTRASRSSRPWQRTARMPA